MGEGQEFKINTRNLKWTIIGFTLGTSLGMPLEAKLGLVKMVMEAVLGVAAE